MINKYTELDILDAEALGRDTVNDAGQLAAIRERYSLSVRGFAALLSTAGQVVSRWEREPESAERMHSMTAVRLGQLVDHLQQVETHLANEGIDNPSSLVPLSTIASEMGLSPSSKLIREKCQSGALRCLELGRLGVYIPRVQADQLRRKEI